MIYVVSNSPLIQDSRFKQVDIKEVLEFVNNGEIFGVDTETEGLFDFENNVIMLQIGNSHDQYVIDTRSIDISPLKSFFEDEKRIKVFWNAKFDINFIRHTFGFKTVGVFDCFLAECLLNAGLDAQLSLNAASIKYLNKPLNKTVRNKFVNLAGVPFNSSQIVYGAEDVEVLLEIKNKQDVLISKYSLESVLKLENLAVLTLADIEYNGIALDTDKWIEVAIKTEKLTDDFTTVLDNIVLSDSRLSRFVPPGIQTNMFGFPERRIQINWGSPKQKLEVLKALGLNIQNSDIRDLLPYRSEPLVSTLLEYSKYKKLSESFGRDFLKFINPVTGRIHQNIWQILSTGRMSSSDPNLTQIPSKGELASLIRAAFIPKEGYKFVGGDFSACELRIIADQSQDPVWVSAFNNGEDLHSKLAALTFDIPIEDVLKPTPFKPDMTYRDVQKTINFGLAYGMSEFKLSKTIDLPVEVAKEIIDRFFAQVPKVKNYLYNIGSLGLKYNFATTPSPFYRKRFFENPGNDFSKMGAVERASKNHPIQGGNSDLIKVALIFIRKYIIEKRLDVKIINVIHDEIITECKEELASEWVLQMNNLMINAAKVVIKTVPVKVDCKINDYWKK